MFSKLLFLKRPVWFKKLQFLKTKTILFFAGKKIFP